MSASRVKKLYRIQITAPMATLLLVLSALSLVATFYLGMVAGKSMRRPPEEIEIVENGESTFENNAITEENLKFFGLGEKKQEPEPLNLEGLKSLKKKTVELTQEPTPVTVTQTNTPKVPVASLPKKQESPKLPAPKIAKQSVQPKAPPKPVIKETPKVVASKRKNQPEYTVQVFATKQHATAEKLVKRLKLQGFHGAYIFKHAPSSGGKALYRVRIGRVGRLESQKLAINLRKLNFIKEAQVTRF